MSMLRKLSMSAPVRKGKAAANRLPRMIRRMTASPQDYRSSPPILVNSLPKSGTHLLMQVADALPGSCNFGSFIAQIPSYSVRARRQSDIESRIAAMVPGEVVGAHLYFNESTRAAIAKRNVLNLFIWRDPRDVLISEAHYLGSMNRWHVMHRVFSKIDDPQERLALAIAGIGKSHYGSARERIDTYLGWRQVPDCVSVRYEDLVDPVSLPKSLDRIMDGFEARGGVIADRNTLRDRLKTAIDPARSHTFHTGGTARWRSEMNEENQRRMREMFPELDWSA